MALISIAAFLVFVLLVNGVAHEECPLRKHMMCPQKESAICPQRKFPNAYFQRCEHHADCPCSSLCCSFPDGCETQCIVPDSINFYGHIFNKAITDASKLQRSFDNKVPSSTKTGSLPENRKPQKEKEELSDDVKMYFPFQTTHVPKLIQLPSENADLTISQKIPPALERHSFISKNDQENKTPEPEKKPIYSGFYNNPKKPKPVPNGLPQKVIRPTVDPSFTPASTVTYETVLPKSHTTSNPKMADPTLLPVSYSSMTTPKREYRPTTRTPVFRPSMTTSKLTYTTHPFLRSSITTPKRRYKTISNAGASVSFPTRLQDFRPSSTTPNMAHTTLAPFIRPTISTPEIVYSTIVPVTQTSISTLIPVVPPSISSPRSETPSQKPSYDLSFTDNNNKKPDLNDLKQFSIPTTVNPLSTTSKTSIAPDFPPSGNPTISPTTKIIQNESIVPRASGFSNKEDHNSLNKELFLNPKITDDHKVSTSTSVNAETSTTKTFTSTGNTDSTTPPVRYICVPMSENTSIPTTPRPPTTEAMIFEILAATTKTRNGPSNNATQGPEEPQVQFRSGAGSNVPVDTKDFRDVSERLGITLQPLPIAVTTLSPKDNATLISRSENSTEDSDLPHGLMAKLLSPKTTIKMPTHEETSTDAPNLEVISRSENSTEDSDLPHGLMAKLLSAKTTIKMPTHEETSTDAPNLEELPTDVVHSNVNNSLIKTPLSTGTSINETNTHVNSKKITQDDDIFDILARSGGSTSGSVDTSTIYDTLKPILNDTTKKHHGSVDADVVTNYSFLNGLEKLSEVKNFSNIALARSSSQPTPLEYSINSKIPFPIDDGFKVETFIEKVSQRLRVVRGNETMDIETVRNNVVKAYGGELKNESFFEKKTVSKVLKPLMEVENESAVYDYKRPSSKIESTVGTTSSPTSINKAKSFRDAGFQARSAGILNEESDHLRSIDNPNKPNGIVGEAQSITLDRITTPTGITSTRKPIDVTEFRSAVLSVEERNQNETEKLKVPLGIEGNKQDNGLVPITSDESHKQIGTFETGESIKQHKKSLVKDLLNNTATVDDNDATTKAATASNIDGKPLWRSEIFNTSEKSNTTLETPMKISPENKNFVGELNTSSILKEITQNDNATNNNQTTIKSATPKTEDSEFAISDSSTSRDLEADVISTLATPAKTNSSKIINIQTENGTSLSGSETENNNVTILARKEEFNEQKTEKLDVTNKTNENITDTESLPVRTETEERNIIDDAPEKAVQHPSITEPRNAFGAKAKTSRALDLTNTTAINGDDASNDTDAPKNVSRNSSDTHENDTTAKGLTGSDSLTLDEEPTINARNEAKENKIPSKVGTDNETLKKEDFALNVTKTEEIENAYLNLTKRSSSDIEPSKIMNTTEISSNKTVSQDDASVTEDAKETLNMDSTVNTKSNITASPNYIISDKDVSTTSATSSSSGSKFRMPYNEKTLISNIESVDPPSQEISTAPNKEITQPIKTTSQKKQ